MERCLALLVVEDETLIAMDLEDMLERRGHRVVDVATSTDRAIAAIARSRDELDGALLDANLGGKISLPVAIALEDAGIPFVMTSAYTSHELARLGFNAPQIRKPYSNADIDRAIRTLSEP